MADVSPDKLEVRYALLIGNANYHGWGALKNPANDAHAMSNALAKLGFKVTTGIDLASAEMLGMVGAFCREIAEASERGERVSSVLFYAGHGIQVDGENYLLPTDTDVHNKLELRTQSIELDVIMEAMGAAARTSIILLDCCRNNPLPRTLGQASFRGQNAAHGLANVRAPNGVYVAFSTQPQFVALDGEGANSPFTEALLQHVDDVELQISEVMMRVRLKVYETTRGEQIPWDHSALFESFVFARVDRNALPSDLLPEVRDRLRRDLEESRQESYWDSVKETRNIRFLQSFLTQFPNSEHREEALSRIDKLQQRSYLKSSAMKVAAVIAGLMLLYYGVTWMRYTKYTNASIIGGSIEADDWREDASYPWCKLRCVALPQCIAFTYDPARSRCDLKSEVAFFDRPRTKQGKTAAFSEIAYGYGQPAYTDFRVVWGRGLLGTSISRAVIEQKAPELKASFKSNRRTNEESLRISSAQCLHLCEKQLGKDVCKGFTHTKWGGVCEVFSSVSGFVIDPRNSRPMFLPSSTSSCLNPAINGCEPR